MGWLNTLSSVGMAVGPPLAYSDQFVSILRKKNSSGFSTDICGVLIIANVTRIIYWLGARFETARKFSIAQAGPPHALTQISIVHPPSVLVQSLLMILFQFALLYVCLLYRDTIHGSIDPRSNQESEALTGAGQQDLPSSHRPWDFWQWSSFGSYIEFTAALILGHSIVFLFLHYFNWYTTALGFVALGLEATLPIPQLLVNFERKSTAGFRLTVLAGWVGGDTIKTIYFFVKEGNSAAFKICAVFQLSVDCLLCAQTLLYREQTQRDLADRKNLEFGGVAGPEIVVTTHRDWHENGDSV